MPFQRRKATPEDDARAREQAPKIHALGRAGVAPSEIARALRLPTASVESVLNSPERERPSGADASPGPALPGPAAVGFSPVESAIPGTPITSQLAGPYQITSTTDQVFQLAREAGLTEPFARGVARRFSYYAADNYDALDRILGESGVGKPARAYIVGGYREATGAPASPLAKAEEASPRREPEDPVDRHRRAMLADLEIRRQRAEVEKLEREARGEVGGATPEVAQLRAQVETLRQALHEKELMDLLSRAVGPLQKEIETLKQAGASRKTTEDVKLDTIATGIGILAEEARGRAHVGKELLAHPETSKIAIKTFQKLMSTPEERGEMLLPPSPEQLAEFQRRMGETEGAPEAPSLIIPGSGKPSRVGPEDES